MSERTVTPVPTLLGYVRTAVFLLASLVALALLVVGTVAVIAELKGTWHWSIHLESTISYAGLFVGWLLVALVPLTGALFAGRVLYE
jgi:hypothetical protein